MKFIPFIFLVMFYVGWAFTFWKVIFDPPTFMKTWNIYSRALVIANFVCFFGMMGAMSFIKA